MLTLAQKQRILHRLHRAWPCGPHVPFAVDEGDRHTWHVTSENIHTGAVWSDELPKRELARQEARNRVQQAQKGRSRC